MATLEDEDLRPFTLADDRAGYIKHCVATKKTRTGITPPVQVASRWFNLAAIISSTEGDVWIHREKDELWWTTSRALPPDVSLQPAFKPTNPTRRVFEIHKASDAWSNKNKNGVRMMWNTLHAKARAFLFTEGTLQQLAADNANYALALIDGVDLGAWHRRLGWKAKENAAGRSAVTVFDARRRAVARMASTAADTVSKANGQQVTRIAKVKELRFANRQLLEKYVADLLEAQEGLCALTDIQLQFDGEHEDVELLCSLDRIDSDGHYELGNLQIVCRFVNRWKCTDDNALFGRLIALVRNTHHGS